MMGVTFDVNKILDSRATGLFVFGVTGVAKLASDYKKAPENKKDFVLLRDSLILGGTAVGVGLYGLASAKCKKTINKKIEKGLASFGKRLIRPIQNTEFYNTRLKSLASKIKPPVRYVAEHAKNIVTHCADNTMMLACGILGAVGADYGIRYSHLDKNRRIRKLSHLSDNTFGSLYNYEHKLKDNFQQSKFNKDLEHVVGSEVKSNMYSRVTDLPAMRMFSRTMVGMQGFEVIEEKTFKKRMKHATGCLISNSLIPLFFLSTATNLTRKMPAVVRAPIVFSSLVGGTMYTNKWIANHEKKIQEKEYQKTLQQNNVEPQQEPEPVPSDENTLNEV